MVWIKEAYLGHGAVAQGGVEQVCKAILSFGQPPTFWGAKRASIALTEAVRAGAQTVAGGGSPGRQAAGPAVPSFDVAWLPHALELPAVKPCHPALLQTNISGGQQRLQAWRSEWGSHKRPMVVRTLVQKRPLRKEAPGKAWVDRHPMRVPERDHLSEDAAEIIALHSPHGRVTWQSPWYELIHQPLS